MRRAAFESRPAQLALVCAVCTAAVLVGYVSALVAPVVAERLREEAPLVSRTADLVGRVLKPLLKGELALRDFLMENGRMAPREPLVFIAIDDLSAELDELDLTDFAKQLPRESTEFRALSLMAEDWPWSREVHALVLDRLFAAGARLVVMDTFFLKESPHDAPLAAALERHRERVVFGSNFAPLTLAEGAHGSKHMRPPDSLVPETQPLDERVAFVNFWADPADGIVRRVRLRTTEAGVNGDPPAANEEVYLSLAARALSKAGLGQLLPPGTDHDHLFRFAGPPLTFRPQSIFQLFVPKHWERVFQNGEALRDRIVMIGPHGNFHHDEHATPFGLMPGPEIHLNAINALLHGELLTELSPLEELLLIVAAGVAAWALALPSTGPLLRAALLLATTALWMLVALEFYNRAGLFIGMLAPLLAFNLSGGSCFIYEFVRERLEKARTRRTLDRYVSRDVVKELLDNRETFLNSLTGVRKEITVLFSDLRGFTSLTETSDPVKLVAQLNEYLNAMVRIVFANSGTLDKFIGDAVMSYWGGIRSEGLATDARRAVATALTMRESLELLNLGWKARGIPALRFGIGINHGDAIVGNLGSEERMEVSVIGDAVNLAARLESATKEYHVEVLLGESVAALVRDHFILQTVDLLQVKGKSRPVEVFTVLKERTDLSEPAWLARYEEGMRLYRRREFAGAATCFGEAARLNPGDYLCEEYVRRAESYAHSPPAADWAGVQVMTSK